MFTGIVEDVGIVTRVGETSGGRRLTIRSRLAREGVPDGASVAVDGACLTVVESGTDTFTMDVIGTTLSRTIAAGYGRGARVNLERAARVDARLDGHLVQGHVDGVGDILEVKEEGSHHLLRFRLPEDVLPFTILHGSITVNGVSLTVNGLGDAGTCEVALIPHTWSHTNLSGLRPGDPVNVEADLIGKYVGRYLDSMNPRTSGPGRTGAADAPAASETPGGSPPASREPKS